MARCCSPPGGASVNGLGIVLSKMVCTVQYGGPVGWCFDFVCGVYERGARVIDDAVNIWLSEGGKRRRGDDHYA